MSFRATRNEWQGSMTSFSGADLLVTFEDLQIGKLQGISVSVSREKGLVTYSNIKTYNQRLSEL